jgi:parallel beta-helix repeat protein
MVPTRNALALQLPLLALLLALRGTAADHAPTNEYIHTGGGLTSAVMSSIISKLPVVTPPKDGVRDDSLMRTVRLSGDYKGDEPLILPSFTRLVLNGSMTALPYALSWTKGSAGDPNETASLVSVKDAVMVSVEGGSWTCADWNSTAAKGNTSTVTAIFFDNTSYSFIRNLNITSCGQYSGGQNSAQMGIGRTGFNSGNIRVSTPRSEEGAYPPESTGDGGGSNVVENVESSYSWNRGIWAQTQKLVVSGGKYHHNDADGIDLDGGSSYNTIHNAEFYMNARCGIFIEFSASFNTIVGNRLHSNHWSQIGTGTDEKHTQRHNVILANVLGPSDYPAGCPEEEREKKPCPSYCPVNDTCQEVVGLPCGTCHYLDQKDYSGGGGMALRGSNGLIAVLNDLVRTPLFWRHVAEGETIVCQDKLGTNIGMKQRMFCLQGGSSSSASGSWVANTLVALNYNGSIDDSGNAPNTSTFSFNPEADNVTPHGAAVNAPN